jgi:hypothetical protein
MNGFIIKSNFKFRQYIIYQLIQLNKIVHIKYNNETILRALMSLCQYLKDAEA